MLSPRFRAALFFSGFMTALFLQTFAKCNSAKAKVIIKCKAELTVFQ